MPIRSDRRFGMEVLDRLSVGVVLMSATGEVQELNQTALAFLDLARDDVVGRPLAGNPLWGRAPKVGVDVAFAVAAAAAGRSQSFDAELLDRHDQPSQFRVTLRPLRTAGGPPYPVVCEAINETAHVQAEKALRESQREIAKAQQLARVGSWSWIVDGNFLTWSPELYRIFGLDPRQWPPTWGDQARLFTAESFARLRAAVEASVQTGAPFLHELEFVHSSGRRGWLLAQCEADIAANGHVLRLRGTAQDITEQRRLHDIARRELAQAQSLAAALEERAALEREMVQFLAHEIRQPLNNASAALQSAAVVLAASGDGAPQPARAPLAHAETVLTHVIGALNNTLAAASLLVAGDTQSFTETDLDTLTGLVLHDIAADQRGRVRIERHAGIRTAQLQSNLMRLALANLLNNALAYSPADSRVTLRISDSDEPLALIFDLVDDGAGIPPEVLSRAFEKGVRGTNAYPRAGAGLGLYIVQRVAALHGGEVTVLPRAPRQPHTVRMTVPQGLAR